MFTNTEIFLEIFLSAWVPYAIGRVCKYKSKTSKHHLAPRPCMPHPRPLKVHNSVPSHVQPFLLAHMCQTCLLTHFCAGCSTPTQESWTSHQHLVFASHQRVLKLVLADVQRLFRRVRLQARLVRKGLYQWPDSGGEDGAWDDAFAAAQHIVSRIPSYPAWCPPVSEPWCAAGYFDGGSSSQTMRNSLQ